MKTYCVKCGRDTENIDTKMVRKKKQINYAIKIKYAFTGE